MANRDKEAMTIRRLGIQISEASYRTIEKEIAASGMDLSVAKAASSIVEAWCLRIERERRKPKAEDYCEARRTDGGGSMPAQATAARFTDNHGSNGGRQ